VPSDITIRLAEEDDLEALQGFHRALYVDHRNELIDPEIEPLVSYRDLETILREDVKSILQNPRGTALLAEHEGEPVGYITGHVVYEPERVLPMRGVIEDWFVTKGQRGRGIGKALFGALRDDFRANGCQLMESATWPFNTGARAAHEQLGFTEYEVRYRMRIG